MAITLTPVGNEKLLGIEADQHEDGHFTSVLVNARGEESNVQVHQNLAGVLRRMADHVEAHEPNQLWEGEIA